MLQMLHTIPCNGVTVMQARQSSVRKHLVDHMHMHQQAAELVTFTVVPCLRRKPRIPGRCKGKATSMAYVGLDHNFGAVMQLLQGNAHSTAPVSWACAQLGDRPSLICHQ